MEIDENTFWKRVDLLISEIKINLGELAVACNISYDTLMTQRTRRSIPKLKQLLDMAHTLGTSVEYLTTGTGPVDRILEYLKEYPEMKRTMLRIAQCGDRQLMILNTLMDSWGISKTPEEIPPHPIS